MKPPTAGSGQYQTFDNAASSNERSLRSPLTGAPNTREDGNNYHNWEELGLKEADIEKATCESSPPLAAAIGQSVLLTRIKSRAQRVDRDATFQVLIKDLQGVVV